MAAFRERMLQPTEQQPASAAPPMKRIREMLAATLSSDAATRTDATRALAAMEETPTQFAAALLELSTAPRREVDAASGAAAVALAAGAQSAQQAAAVYLKNLIRKQYTKAMGETAERAALRRGVLDAVLRQSGGAGGRACERALCEALHEMVTADLPHGRWDELPAELATLLQGAGGADENDAADRSASFPGALAAN